MTTTRTYIDTTKYVRSHARTPRSAQYGSWWFQHEGGCTYEYQGTYRDALRQLRTVAAGRWEVLP